VLPGELGQLLGEWGHPDAGGDWAGASCADCCWGLDFFALLGCVFSLLHEEKHKMKIIPQTETAIFFITSHLIIAENK
jgi:hypothetical protein